MPTQPPLQQRFQFMESQAAHIESRVRMIQHAYIQYPELVGISREASPHADSIIYYSYDGTGRMISLANRANDIPLLEVQRAQHSVPLDWRALAYDWSDWEIGRAMYVGQNLPDQKVRTAFRIAEEEKERVFLYGDTDLGWDGMINNPNIPVDTESETWDNADDKEIFRNVNELLGGAWVQTNQVRICDTLLLPLNQLVSLGRPMGDSANRSILQYIAEHNIYTQSTGKKLMIKTLRQLDGAGAGGTDRAIAYPRDMEVLRFHVPQELQFIEPQRVGMTWVYHGTMSLAGLEIMEPNAMRYLDGI